MTAGETVHGVYCPQSHDESNVRHGHLRILSSGSICPQKFSSPNSVCMNMPINLISAYNTFDRVIQVNVS